MKTLLVAITAFGLVVGLALNAQAAPPEKVEICHMNSANDTFVYEDIPYKIGRVLEVPEPAVEAHVAHGDSLRFCEFQLTHEERLEYRKEHGFAIPNGNCIFRTQIQIPL